MIRLNRWMALAPLALVLGVAAQTPPPQSLPPQSLPLEPGLWEVTARPDFKGIPVMAVPKVSRRCLSETDIAAAKLPLASLPDCRVAAGQWTDVKAQLDIQCEGLAPGVKVLGEVVAAGKTLSGGIELIQPVQPDGAVAPVSIKYQHSGRWLGPSCGVPVGSDGLGPKY